MTGHESSAKEKYIILLLYSMNENSISTIIEPFLSISNVLHYMYRTYI